MTRKSVAADTLQCTFALLIVLPLCCVARAATAPAALAALLFCYHLPRACYSCCTYALSLPLLRCEPNEGTVAPGQRVAVKVIFTPQLHRDTPYQQVTGHLKLA